MSDEMTDTSSTTAEKREFGRYVLLESVGKGGVGTVYRAREESTGRIAAVKIFNAAADRPLELVRKLRDREVRMLLAVQHPNIVKFYETGEVGEDFYYAMEYVENSLLKCMRGGRQFDLLDKVRILRQVSGALAAVHHQGIVHRDIKPGNILIEDGETGVVRVKVTDLGIARNVSETDIVREQRDGRVPGTPKYLAPEQILQGPVDGRSDIFSLGVVAYELLTGLLPFDADTTEEFRRANTQQTQPPVLDVADDIPAFLSDVVDRMLLKEREQRYDSDTLLRDLQLIEQHLVSGAPLVERTNAGSIFYRDQESEDTAPVGPAIAPVSWAAAAVVAFSGLVAGAFLWPGRAESAQAAAPESQPAERLAAAAAAADDGRPHHAFAILQDLQAEALPDAHAARAADLRSSVADELARRWHGLADGMLAQGRQAEARAVLEAMEKRFPDSPWTGRLRGAIQAESQRQSSESQWRVALQETYRLVQQERFGEALKRREELLQQAAGDEGRAERARGAVRDLMVSWGRSLLEGEPPDGQIRQYLRALQDGPDRASPEAGTVSDQLHLELGRRRERDRDYERAATHYAEAARSVDRQVAARAVQGATALLEKLNESPADAESLGQRGATQQMAAPIWLPQSGPAAQRLQDGVLSFSTSGQGDAGTVRRSMLYPVDGLNFMASVRFRTPQPGGRAGLSADDLAGGRYDLVLDGQRYLLVKRLNGSEVPVEVSSAAGDENAQWHELGLRYDFDAGRLIALLDGEEEAVVYVGLGPCRFSLMMDSAGKGPASAEFKEFTLGP